MTLLKDYPLVSSLNGNEKILITDPDTSDAANNVLATTLAAYIANDLSAVTSLQNAGNLGQGIAKGITSNTAQFYNIAPGSSKISFFLDGINNNILIDLVSSNVNINDLGSTPLAIANGGTNATSASQVLSNIGAISENGSRPLTANWSAGNFSATFNGVSIGSSSNQITGLSLIVNGSGNLTLPSITTTIIGRNTTDALTNKTIDGSMNSLTNIDLSTSTIGVLSVLKGGTGVSASTGSGSVVLNTSPSLLSPSFSNIVNTGILTLPTSTDTLVGRSTTDSFSNKSISGLTNTITNISLTSSVSGTLPVANGGTGTTTSTGSGSTVLSNSPTFSSPNLGVASSTSQSISGTAGNGYLDLGVQSSAPSSGAANSVRLFSNANGQLSYKRQTDGFVRSINSTLTADRIYTLQDSSDTFVMRATVDTLTNKTYDTAASGNVFKVNGVLINAVTGSGSAVLSSSPSLTSPSFSTIVNTGTLTLPLSTDTLVGRATSDTLTNKVISGSSNTITNIPLSTSVSGLLPVANGGSGVGTSTGTGSVVLSVSPSLTTPSFSSIVNTGTLSLPVSTDTLLGRATTDTLTNKTISGSSNTISNISLTTSVTGTLPVANGGTGVNSSTGTGSVVLSSSPSLTTPNIGSATGTNANLTNTTNQLVLGVTNTTTVSSIAPAASRSYAINDLGANGNFVLSTTAKSYNFYSGTTGVQNPIVWTGSATVTTGIATFFPTNTGLVGGTTLFPTAISSAIATAVANTTTTTSYPFASIQAINAGRTQVTVNVGVGTNPGIGGATIINAPNGTVVYLTIWGN